MKYINLSLFVAAIFGSIFASIPAVFAQTYNYSYPYNYPYNQTGYVYNQYGSNNRYNNGPYTMEQYYANRLPVYTSTPVTAAIVGQAYVYDVRAFDPDSNKITYALSQAPAGMVINQVTHVISWTPSATGSFPVTVAITDYANQPVYQNFTISVSAAAQPTVSQATSQPSNTTNTTANTANGGATFGVFRKGKVKPLAIENITVATGPRNINNTVANANCSVAISWTTTVPSAGRVVYGTVSQPNVNTLNYDQVAIEGSALATSHAVTLPSCVDEQVYYFRVIAATNSEQIASEERVIMPLAVQVSGETRSTAPGIGSASVLASIGRFFINPIFLMIIVGIGIFYAFRKIYGGSAEAGHGSGDSHDNEAEPSVAIPSHH